MEQGSDAGLRACGSSSRAGLAAALLLAACVLLGVAAHAAAAGPVEIAASIGFTDTFRPGYWTPLSITVTNRGADFSGTVDVQVSADDALRGRDLAVYHRRSIELARDARRTLDFIVHPQGLSQPVVVHVRSGGQELARSELELRTRFAAQRLLLVLSRDARLDYLNDSAPDGLRVLYPHPELLPRHWRGYDAVSAVVLNGISLERLGTRQFEALRKWIAQGGVLAISGGADYALLRTARLAGLLPGVPQGLMPLDPAAVQRAFPGTPAGTVHVHRLGAYQGRVRQAAGDVPLVIERDLGLGRVVYLTFDVATQPFDRWDGMRALLLAHLRLAPAGNAPAGAPETSSETALMALVRAAAPDFPAASIAFLFLILYLGVLLAGHALSLQGTRRRSLAPLLGWAAPVVFAPLAWLLFGPPPAARGAHAASVALIEPLPDSGYARLAFELGIFASRNGPLRFDYLGAEPVLAPHRQARRAGKVEDWIFGLGPRPFVEPLDERRYVLHALEGEDVIPFRLQADVHDEGAGARLVVDNASGRALEAAWLVYGERAYRLGAIAAGARLDRKLAAAEGTDIGAIGWPDALKSPGGAAEPRLEPARMLLKQRLQELGARAAPAPGHALLIALTASPLRPAGTAQWSHQDSALVVLRIPAGKETAHEETAGLHAPVHAAAAAHAATRAAPGVTAAATR